MVFRANCSKHFLIFLSTVPCTPLYLTLSLFFASSIDSVYAPVSGCGQKQCLFSILVHAKLFVVSLSC